jgi:hypothetical protein
MKKFHSALIAALMAGTFGSIAVPSVAVADTIVVQTAPPPLRAERTPPPRRGYVWAPGHWEWHHNRHVWVGGQWFRERHGYTYANPNWVERDGHWVMERGGWTRGGHDRDGDGVPNRMDARPNNPNRS